MTFRVDLADGVCRCRLPGGRFLSTGFDGGVRVADAAYNVTVPNGWGDEGVRDLRSYVDARIVEAGFVSAGGDAGDSGRVETGRVEPGRVETGRVEPDRVETDAPALLTGVDQTHARVARLDEVAVVATAGLSNPAALPIGSAEDDVDRETVRGAADRHPPLGTVNLVVGTDRDLSSGALANLVAVVAEAKAATLLSSTGFPGTTSDAIVVASDPVGEPTAFSGSATPVGSATRACVRDALLASLESRYDEEETPTSVADAEHGVVTDEAATVSRIEPLDPPDASTR